MKSKVPGCGDNGMIPGAVHRSPGIYLTAEENLGKPQLGDYLMKRLATCHSLKWGPLPPNEARSIVQHVRKRRKERKKEPE